MECGLTLFKTSKDAFKIEHGRGLGFSENIWGNMAREFVRSTQRLQAMHWMAITVECSKYWCGIPASDFESDENPCDEGHQRVNPRACIEIDW